MAQPDHSGTRCRCVVFVSATIVIPGPRRRSVSVGAAPAIHLTKVVNRYFHFATGVPDGMDWDWDCPPTTGTLLRTNGFLEFFLSISELLFRVSVVNGMAGAMSFRFFLQLLHPSNSGRARDGPLVMGVMIGEPFRERQHARVTVVEDIRNVITVWDCRPRGHGDGFQ